ncbi:E3 ubiquitin-protein ligase RNF5 [Babesia microti strain RI]|uniref:RING-type E3 ubiquitin transferase n=1 Tax=Babesia microti (strain RI) TaxID=1133968 RepID=A0A1R4ACH6_BABMR|nr:E3 ubiquitin-protein ligase RNF5 [Babesia microti strain RI]SJK86719.1 E3 ubiquitin-protein ligase RNF5 [Babesia microti strain RI]|eukprot:XP_021338842.1 E3 ubiquitin-protein ligase RNF5 [Babesia microti strain RI]
MSKSNSCDQTNNNGSKCSNYECNICFDDAKEPVVTRCGHLFCWNCLEIWLDRNMNECPLCKSEVTRDNVIPLYGRGCDSTDPRKSTRPKPKTERAKPSGSANRNATQSIFGNSISFWAFPFSFGVTFRSSDFRFPIGNLFGSTFGSGFPLGFGNQMFSQNPQDAETDQRRAMSTFLLTVGLFIMFSLIMY